MRRAQASGFEPRGRGSRPSAIVVVTLFSLAVGLSLADVARAAVIGVTTTADVLAADGDCSLREAISAANTDTTGPGGDCTAGGGADSASLPAGTFTLSRPGSGEDDNVSGDLDILGPLTISGAGRSATAIDANQIDRVLEVRPGRVAAIEDVTITGGLAPKGANGQNVTGPVGVGSGAGAMRSPVRARPARKAAES